MQLSQSTRRWIEPKIDDYPSFFRTHPETVVDSALLAELSEEVACRARALEFDPEQAEEIQNEINLRVIEAATSYRIDPETEQPIYDYLKQNRRYIVWHASGKVYSRLRRERRQMKQTISLSNQSVANKNEEDEQQEDAPIALSYLVDFNANLEYDELRRAIVRRLTPAQRKVFYLLEVGFTRSEISEILRRNRRTVCDHVRAIRKVVASLTDEFQIRHFGRSESK